VLVGLVFSILLNDSFIDLGLYIFCKVLKGGLGTLIEWGTGLSLQTGNFCCLFAVGFTWRVCV